jgi:AcrR family transcriptional regulator
MQQRSEETRQHILEAAHRLFSQHGYDATSVAEICAEAGMSKGAFYHHFPAKQAVFLALLEIWLGGLEGAFDATRSETGSVPQAILQMADMAGGIFDTTDMRLSIFLEFWTQAYRDPAVWQAAIAPYRRYQEYFASLVQEGVAQGSLREVDTQQAARVLVSLAVGVLMQALFDPEGANWAQETRESVRLLLEGLARKNEQ